jgi:N-acetylglucosamine-6-phosphate deacetylase
MYPMDIHILKNLNIYTDQQILHQAHITICNGIIKSINTCWDLTPTNLGLNPKTLEFPSTWHLIPGMIDMHTHGLAGADTMDATPQALDTMSQALPKEGVTGFLASTISADLSDIENALKNAHHYVQNTKETQGAKLLGIHLEGPFLSPEKPGSQLKQYLLTPNISYMKRWQSLAPNLIKMTTIAPELPGCLEFIQYLKQQNIIAAIGHTNADYAKAMEAISAGCTQTTHLYNAMRSIHHREPGAVIAALLSDQISTEIIADGIHLHPAIIQCIVKLKGFDRTLLITDAMRAKQLQDGLYDFNGQQVIVQNKAAKLNDGTLAASVLGMDEAVRNMIQFTGCTLKDTIKMSSTNPAIQLGIIDRKGSIAIGKDADLVILDENYQVRFTMVEGKILHTS